MAKTLHISRPISRTLIRRKIRQTLNHRLRERLQALLWFAEGNNCLEIAHRLGRCRQVVSNYLKIYDREGLDKLFHIGRGPGRQSQLSDKDKDEIRKWVLSSPRDLGCPFNNWDCKRMAIHIEKCFHVRLSREQVRRMLHKMNFRLLRPRHKLLQANPELIIKKNARFKGLWLPLEKIEELSSSLKTR